MFVIEDWLRVLCTDISNWKTWNKCNVQVFKSNKLLRCAYSHKYCKWIWWSLWWPSSPSTQPQTWDSYMCTQSSHIHNFASVLARRWICKRFCMKFQCALHTYSRKQLKILLTANLIQRHSNNKVLLNIYIWKLCAHSVAGVVCKVKIEVKSKWNIIKQSYFLVLHYHNNNNHNDDDHNHNHVVWTQCYQSVRIYQ